MVIHKERDTGQHKPTDSFIKKAVPLLSQLEITNSFNANKHGWQRQKAKCGLRLAYLPTYLSQSAFLLYISYRFLCLDASVFKQSNQLDLDFDFCLTSCLAFTLVAMAMFVSCFSQLAPWLALLWSKRRGRARLSLVHHTFQAFWSCTVNMFNINDFRWGTDPPQKGQNNS